MEKVFGWIFAITLVLATLITTASMNYEQGYLDGARETHAHMESRETDLHYGDYVQVKTGFFKGFRGRVRDVIESLNPPHNSPVPVINKYRVDFDKSRLVLGYEGEIPDHEFFRAAELKLLPQPKLEGEADYDGHELFN